MILKSETDRLVICIRNLHPRTRNKDRRILLIADQFEEAFTLVADDAIRNRFIDVLLAGFPDPAMGSVADICLILTMRADFYGSALRHRPPWAM